MAGGLTTFDLEYVFGEFGDTYFIKIVDDNGNDADLTIFDTAQLTVSKMDDTELFTTTEPIDSPFVEWDMAEEETTALGYTGKIKAQVELTATTTKKRMTKIFSGFIYTNQVP